MNDNFSLSDIAAVTKDADGFGGGSWWIIVFLIYAMMGGNGFGGGAATGADIQRAVDLNSIQQGQADIAADVQRTTYETMATVKDAAYNNLSEIRDSEMATTAGFSNVINSLTNGFANQSKCCCETQRAIDGVNYNVASQSAAIQATSTANTQKILDAIAGNRMADMQSQINNLQLQLATSGVVKYPMASTFSMNNPFCGCGC